MKEKRLLIKEIKEVCVFRKPHLTEAGGASWIDYYCGCFRPYEKECDDKCFNECECKRLAGFSRQKAIERISKIIATDDNATEKAEKVIKALLEGNNESH